MKIAIHLKNCLCLKSEAEVGVAVDPKKIEADQQAKIDQKDIKNRNTKKNLCIILQRPNNRLEVNFILIIF